MSNLYKELWSLVAGETWKVELNDTITDGQGDL